MTDPINAPTQPAKARRGCFFYGCITSLVLLLVLTIAIIAGVYYVKKKVSGLVANYTDTQPMTLQSVQMSTADLDKLKQRFDGFEQAVRDGKPTEPLVLTADEINALIATGADAQKFKGKIYITLDGDKVKGDVSLPLQDIGLKMFKGRYLNGSGTFSVSLQDGVLFVAPQTITVKGQTVPDVYMQGIRNQNFAAGLTNDPDARAVLGRLQEIRVKDGKVTVVPKEVK
jgi:hypothetical protein